MNKLIERDREENRDQSTEVEDPVLAMLGVGKELWETEPADRFVERLRSEDLPAPPVIRRGSSQAESQADAVWRRVIEHQGKPFRTATGLPFTFQAEGAGMWFFREGKRIERKLSRKQFEIALSRCPLTSTTEIKDLIDYPYLYGVLMDRRIRDQAW